MKQPDCDREKALTRKEIEREERERREREREDRERFVNGLKRYTELGIPIYIDNREPGPDDWEKLTMIREDNRFYMGDFVQNAETGKLKEIRFDMVYHGDIRSGQRRPPKNAKKTAGGKKRGKKPAGDAEP